MQSKILCEYVHNLGDFFNAMPVVSGISKALNEPVKLVVSSKLRAINGFREFMEYQNCISELFYRDEIIGLDENSYIRMHYSSDEFRYLNERPYAPIETMRHERFVRDNNPQFAFMVDHDFNFETSWIDYEGKYLVGDRWLNSNTDTRRSSYILKDSGVFDDPKFEFLDYSVPLMDNAAKIASCRLFFGTFTGSGMLADLLNVPNYCVYCDDMVDPPWNNAPIEYSYWKHYYRDRENKLIHINDAKELVKVL